MESLSQHLKNWLLESIDQPAFLRSVRKVTTRLSNPGEFILLAGYLAHATDADNPAESDGSLGLQPLPTLAV
jgi:hypothetical protein